MAANEDSSVSVGKATILGALIGAMAGAATAVLARSRRREEPEPIDPRPGHTVKESAMIASVDRGLSNGTAGGGLSGGTAGGGQSGGGTAGGGLGGGTAGGGLSGGGTSARA